MPVSNKVEINELSDSESLKINYQRKTLKEHKFYENNTTNKTY